MSSRSTAAARLSRVVLPTILADQGRTHVDEVMNVAVGSRRSGSSMLTERSSVPGRADERRSRIAERRGLSWSVVLLALAAGALAVSAILRTARSSSSPSGWSVAISPLAANLSAGTIKLNQRLRRHVG